MAGVQQRPRCPATCRSRGGAGQSPAVYKLSHLNLLSLFVGPFKFLLYGQQPGKSDSFY